MRATGSRAAVVRAGLGCGGGSFVAKSERSMPSTTLLRILATVIFFIGLGRVYGVTKGVPASSASSF
jgi:hypothetical protein